MVWTAFGAERVVVVAGQQLHHRRPRHHGNSDRANETTTTTDGDDDCYFYKQISAKPNSSKSNDHVARLRVVQEVSSRNSSASWNSSCTFSTEQSVQDQPRPPVYNVEDYARSLRKFGRRGQTPDGNNGDPLDQKQTEMTLKEFTSTTELLEKLSADLKLAYFSFVQEFVGNPIDGVTLLLELLKTIQQNGSQTKCTPANQRRITLDENTCLQCLQYCLRCQDAARKLAISPAGLYTLAACIMSTVNHSRLLTLELLTKACCESGTADGHSTVSDAMSTMRLRFAEPVRFRFLVGMMSGNGSSGMELLLAGLKFINAFTETCPDLQTRFYVQAELKQAGFKPAGILKNISNKSPLLSSVSDEIYRWQKNFINVESLKKQHDEVTREAKSLREKVAMLEKKIHVLQDEKRAMISSRNGKDSTINHVDGPQKTTIDHRSKIENGVNGDGSGGGGGGNSAEDEGISSSEQDDCEDDVPPPAVITRKDDDIIVAINGVGGGYNKKASYGLSSSQGGGGGGTVTTTTVDGVLEDFDKVINDASTESREGRRGVGDRRPSSASSRGYTDDRVLYPRRLRYYLSSDQNDSSGMATDDAIIVPTRIVPEPPRRSRSLFVNKNFEVNPFFEDEEDEEEEEDESGADSECAYDDEEDDDAVDNKCGGGRITKRGGSVDETFHSVQKQIERFSALALRRGGGPAGDHGILQKRRDEDEIKTDLQQHSGGGGGRRKSIYDVFAGVERPEAMTYGCGGTRVTRSASTRNAVDPRTPVIPRFVNHCVGNNKSVYLPGGRGDATTDVGDPKAFVATRTNSVGNNAGLYSGYKDPTMTQPKCVGFGVKSVSTGSGSSSSKEGPKALHHVNLPVSIGKLTDFPSGLY